MTIEKSQPMLASDIQNLTFFPKGTILMYDGWLWDRAGGIPGWHICDGQGGTINLTDKFIRGGATARVEGGTDTADVPYHTHNVTDPGHGHVISDPGHGHSVNDPGHSHQIIEPAQYAGDGNKYHQWHLKQNGRTSNSTTGISISNASTGISISKAQSGISIGYTGSSNSDNRPAFCTVIFIEKITNYLE
jgi:hypothetical protein